MDETQRRLIQGVIIGCFIGAGAMFMVFWYIMTSAPNAGAMVDGQFHPYSADPAGYVLLGGGVLMLAVALAFLAVTWRGIGGSRS